MQYEVVVTKTTTQHKEFIVEADGVGEASDIAQQLAANEDFWSWEEVESIEYDVVSIEETNRTIEIK